MTHTVSHGVQVDLDRLFVDVRLSGLVTPEDAGWIGEEVRAAIRSLGDKVGRHVTLYDASGVQVVPPATVELLKQTFDNPQVRALWARKVAFVTNTALARLQAQRLREVRPDLGLFDDRETAIAWLLEG
ncbi:hypothetical protein TPR58_08240 [Sphingomonas sp. HF-S3]|uniref:STAS/SEC14 domain-containing protein n=1 Tax=Sphingomonas rustica TaxID=3103142 RepID=A0ABV0B6F9_9SPHN